MKSTLTMMLIAALVIGLAAGAVGQGVVSVEGQVSLPNGDPIEGVRVTATNVSTGAKFHSQTNESGAYSINLPPGIYNITATYTNYTANTSYDELMVNESVVGINFTMSELLGTLTGYVTNGTAPITQATVVLVNELGNYSGNSNPFGVYEITGIAPGVYIAYAEKGGYWAAFHECPVEIRRGEVTRLNFTLEEQPAVLFGRVTYGGSGLVGVKVEIRSDEFTTSTLTDSQGNYTLSEIPLGSYTITFSKEGFVEETMTIALSPFESRKLDLTMEREVTDTGGFIPGFDLPHSLMIVGLILSIITLILAIFIKLRVQKDPALFMPEEEE